MENTELKAYFEKFNGFPYLPIMASYDDDTYQYLLTMAILREQPLTEEEVEEAYNGKIDLVEENTDKEKGDADVDTNMDDKAQKKIRVLLKRYGADGKEIENFMRDLLEFKEASEEDKVKSDEKEIEDEEDFNYLDEETIAKLKATEDGKDLIMNAPKMAKDELKKAIMEYLSK